jgi:hypothetical protein
MDELALSYIWDNKTVEQRAEANAAIMDMLQEHPERIDEALSYANSWVHIVIITASHYNSVISSPVQVKQHIHIFHILHAFVEGIIVIHAN